MIEFLAFIFACAFGFGLAFWIAATALDNSNNFGDYHADASHYSASVNFTSDENLTSKAGREGYVGEGAFKKPSVPLAPKGKELIQKPVAPRVKNPVQSAAPAPAPAPKAQIPKAAPASVPEGKDPSAFPRSFHDV